MGFSSKITLFLHFIMFCVVIKATAECAGYTGRTFYIVDLLQQV